MGAGYHSTTIGATYLFDRSLERSETNNEDKYFGSPVGVSSEENSIPSEGTNTSATSAKDLDPELPSAVDRPTSGPAELSSCQYPEHHQRRAPSRYGINCTSDLVRERCNDFDISHVTLTYN